MSAAGNVGVKIGVKVGVDWSAEAAIDDRSASDFNISPRDA